MGKKNCIWGSTHEITDEQREQIEATYENILPLDTDLLGKVSNLQPEDDFAELAFDVLAYAGDYEADLIQVGGNASFQTILGETRIKYFFDRDDLDSFVSLIYAESRRESAEAMKGDGSVRKISVFRHIGWRVNGKFVEKLVPQVGELEDPPEMIEI